MLVRMIKNTVGCDVDANGVILPAKQYRAGEEYFLGASLANAFVNHLKTAVIAEYKSMPGAPENKMMPDAEENKAEPKKKRGRQRKA
jgi:hypothetical protein